MSGDTIARGRCETCRFWCGRVVGRVYNPGDCRRFPPAVATQGRGWPIMGINDWCGEYQSAPIAHENEDNNDDR